MLTCKSYTISSNISSTLGNQPIDSEAIIAEIDDGRPLVIATSERLNALSHVQVGYGYQYYTYPN